MKHVGTKTIETARLILRRLELTDAEMMFRNWTSDDKVTRFLRMKVFYVIIIKHETDFMIVVYTE